MRLLAAAFALLWLAAMAASVPARSIAQDNPCAGNPLAVEPAVGESTESVAPAADAPLWMTLELTDACTGESFTLADFVGRTVYVEPMATWCTNCHKQLTNARGAKELLNSDDFVFIALSVEVDLAREALAAYSETEGFPFVFAVMSPDMLQAVVEDFGREASVPPATPHFIISPNGTTVSELTTGFESPEDLAARLTAIHEAAA